MTLKPSVSLDLAKGQRRYASDESSYVLKGIGDWRDLRILCKNGTEMINRTIKTLDLVLYRIS